MQSNSAITASTSSVQNRGSSIILLIIILLVYGATVQCVVSESLMSLVEQNQQENRFKDTAALLTFMRVGVILWVIMASFLQALSLRLIYRGVVGGASPTLLTSWRWALTGQIPFIVVAAGTLMVSGGSDVGFLGGTGLRIAFGASASLIYSALAYRAFTPQMIRLAIFFMIVTIINSVLLVTASP